MTIAGNPIGMDRVIQESFHIFVGKWARWLNEVG